MNKLVYIVIAFCYTILVYAKSDGGKTKEKPSWAKKDIRDYSDADMERLFDQWEEGEDPLPPDELPEHLRPSPKIDLTKLNLEDTQDFLKVTKKGRTLMTFVSVSGNPTREETEHLTTLWQTDLWNNHIQVERYLVDDNRAIFLYQDGALVWEAKDHLIEQERCESVSIEGQVYPGKYSKKQADSEKLSDEL